MVSKMNKNLLASEFTKNGGLVRLEETREEKGKFESNVALAKKLERDALLLLKTTEYPRLVFDALSSKIWELKLSEGWTGEIFGGLDSKIRNRFGDASYSLPALRDAAIEHFTTNLKADFNFNTYDDVENVRLVEILQQIKKKLKGMESYEIKAFDMNCERFKFAALEKMHDELETEIAERQVMAEQKKKLETTEEANTDIAEKKTGKANPKNFATRTQRQVFLALEILLRHSLFAGNNRKKAKLMSFFSNYSIVQLTAAFSESDNWDDKAKDLEYILDIFSEAELKSKKIIDELRTEISKAKTE